METPELPEHRQFVTDFERIVAKADALFGQRSGMR